MCVDTCERSLLGKYAFDSELLKIDKIDKVREQLAIFSYTIRSSFTCELPIYFPHRLDLRNHNKETINHIHTKKDIVLSGKPYKKIRQWLYKAFGIKIEEQPHLASKLSDILSMLNSKPTETPYYRVTKHLGRFVGRFGDAGSCFDHEGCNRHHREAMEEEDFMMMCLYETDDEDSGHSRCWITPFDDYVRLWNGYSDRNIDVAAMGELFLYHLRQCGYQKACEANNVRFHTDLYENGDSFDVSIYGKDALFRICAELVGNLVPCECCGDSIDIEYGDYYGNENGCYCEHCFHQHFRYCDCDQCDSIIDTRYNSAYECGSDIFCSLECAHQEDCFLCVYCDELHESDDLLRDKDEEFICEQCAANEGFERCEECDCLHPSEELHKTDYLDCRCTNCLDADGFVGCTSCDKHTDTPTDLYENENQPLCTFCADSDDVITVDGIGVFRWDIGTIRELEHEQRIRDIRRLRFNWGAKVFIGGVKQ